MAQRHSLCHDDALDAYQRALEVFVRRVETVDRATELAWLKVVGRHEAMAIRRGRSESVPREEIDRAMSYDEIAASSGAAAVNVASLAPLAVGDMSSTSGLWRRTEVRLHNSPR